MYMHDYNSFTTQMDEKPSWLTNRGQFMPQSGHMLTKDGVQGRESPPARDRRSNRA